MIVSTVRFMEEHVLVSASLDGSIRIWDCLQSASVSEVAGIQSRDGITSMEPVKLFGEGSVVITGTKSGALYVRDFRFPDGQGDKTVVTNSDPVSSIALDDSFEVASGDSKGRVEVRDIRSLRSVPLVSMNGSRFNTDLQEVRPTGSFSDIRKEDQSVLTEDMWDIAMGKKASKRRSARDHRDTMPAEKSISRESKPISFESAHSRRVVLVHFVSPNLIITIGEDKLVKLFSSSSGVMLRALSLRDKPTSSVCVGDQVFIGDRNGIGIAGVSLTDQTMQRIINPHTGSVSALAACAEWGFCSGGTDNHIFLHSLTR
jgi:WD40 repeat protein